MEFLFLGAAWFLLFILTFRPPDTPKLTRLMFFYLWVLVSFALAFVFLIKILGYNPNPGRLRMANLMTDNKLIDLTQIAPGVYDLDYIHRVDTDVANNQEEPDEWLVFYQYDVTGLDTEKLRGPFGGAIYEPDRCRPPAILSYELVPLHYDYLAQDAVDVKVDNIIAYADPLSLDRMGMEMDRPEVIIAGRSRGVTTDLNVFRKVGTYQDCFEVQEWRRENPGLPCPYERRVAFQNIGNFRGSYHVALQDATVTVKDSAGFERSQIVVKRVYVPNSKYGNYFLYTDGGLLVEPVQLAEPIKVGLEFGPGQPDAIRQVYYPEKTVIAFFLNLGPNPDRAMGLVCGGGKGSSEYHPQDFGLTLPLRDLNRVAICELGYTPNIPAEQLHDDTTIKVKVQEVTGTDYNDCKNTRSLECTVSAAPNPKAQPYGCEWCLLECHEATW